MTHSKITRNKGKTIYFNKGCVWHCDEYGVWHTDCEHLYVINEGLPSDNSMKYCCFCGKEIIEYELLC